MTSWISAMRLRTLPLSIAGIITGGVMAYQFDAEHFETSVFLLAILTALLLQILSNFANDYGDFENGADNAQRVGPKRAVQSGAITAKEMKSAIYLTIFITLCSGITLLYMAFRNFDMKFIVYFLIGIASIAAAIKYTMGKNPYGYRGLGDLFVFVFFGLVSSCGTYFLLTHHFSYAVLLPSISIGAWSTAVLNLNNLRDIENDKETGKITIPVQLGRDKGLKYHYLIIFTPFLCNITYALLEDNFHLLGLTLLSLLFGLLIFKPLFKNPDTATLDKLLKKTALFALFFTMLFATGILLHHFVSLGE